MFWPDLPRNQLKKKLSRGYIQKVVCLVNLVTSTLFYREYSKKTNLNLPPQVKFGQLCRTATMAEDSSRYRGADEEMPLLQLGRRDASLANKEVPVPQPGRKGAKEVPAPRHGQGGAATADEEVPAPRPEQRGAGTAG